MSDRESLFSDSRVTSCRRLARKYAALASAVENGTHAAFIVTRDEWVDTATLAARLGLTIQAANNRAKALHDLGICERRYVSLETGGRRWDYRWVYDWNGSV